MIAELITEVAKEVMLEKLKEQLLIARVRGWRDACYAMDEVCEDAMLDYIKEHTDDINLVKEVYDAIEGPDEDYYEDYCEGCGKKERDDWLLHFCDLCQEGRSGKGGFCFDCRFEDEDSQHDTHICLNCKNEKTIKSR